MGGLDQLFAPEREIVLADRPEGVLARLRDPDPDRARRQGEAARTRVLEAHTAAHRAEALERYFGEARARRANPAPLAAAERPAFRAPRFPNASFTKRPVIPA